MNFILQTIRKKFQYLINLCATFLSQIASAASVIILTPVLLSGLGAEQFGLYGVLLNVIILSSVFDFGLNIGLLRKLIFNKEDAVSLINTLFFFFSILFITSIPIFYLLFSVDLIHTGNSYFFFACVIGVLILQNVLALFFDVIIQVENKIYVGKIIRVSKTIAETTVLILLSKQGSIQLLLIASVGINFFYILSLFLFSKKVVNYKLSLYNFCFSILLSHIRYSFWYFLNALAGAMVFNAQVIVISGVVGAVMAAKFILVTRFFDIIRIGLTNFTTILFPFLAMRQAEENYAHIKSMFLKIFKRVILLSGLTLILTMTVGQQIFKVWNQQADILTMDLYKWVAIFVTLVVIDNVPTVFLNALKLNTYQTIIAIVQGILGLILGYIFLLEFGLVGVGIASIVALLVTNFFFSPIYLLRAINKKLTSGHIK